MMNRGSNVLPVLVTTPGLCWVLDARHFIAHLHGVRASLR